MPSASDAPRVPSYRRHKPSGQAVVTLNGRDIYLRPWNTRASRTEYDRLIGEWLAGARCLPTLQSSLTVAELAIAYLDSATLLDDSIVKWFCVLGLGARIGLGVRHLAIIRKSV